MDDKSFYFQLFWFDSYTKKRKDSRIYKTNAPREVVEKIVKVFKKDKSSSVADVTNTLKSAEYDVEKIDVFSFDFEFDPEE